MVVPNVVVLMVAGLQVPVMLLFDVVGNAGAVAFWHSGPIWVKVGMMDALMVISIVVDAPHCPALGVKV